MAPGDFMYINDQPLQTALGVIGTQLRNHLSSARVFRSEQVMPGSFGGVLDEESQSRAGEIVVRGYVDPAQITGRQDAVSTIHQKAPGLLELRFSDEPDRVAEGYLAQVLVAPWANMVEPTLVVDLTFQLTRAHRENRYGRVVSFNSTASEIQLGNLKSGGEIHIYGPTTNPELYLRHPNDTLIQAMQFTAVLAETDYIRLEIDEERIYLNDTERADLKTGGNWIRPDGADGDQLKGVGVNLSSNGPECAFLYAERWSS